MDSGTEESGLIFLMRSQSLFSQPAWFKMQNGAASWLGEVMFCLEDNNCLREDAISIAVCVVRIIVYNSVSMKSYSM